MTTDTATTANAATGPKTAEGKRIAARNATTHGLFARDVVLPRLGEDPQAYEASLQELTNQLSPKNLLEQHYAEKIAAASWRLRRLHRWQAQLFEDVEMPEDEVMLKMDRVMRHETTLHRQIDTSVKMLGRELPRLFEGRVREDLIRRMNATERTLKDDPYLDQWLTAEARKRSSLPTCPPSLDLSRLDTADNTEPNCQNGPAACTGAACCAPTVRTCHAPADTPHTKCQNEPALVNNHPLPKGEVASLSEPEGSPQSRRDFPSLGISPALQNRDTNCQNEPALAPSPPAPHYWGGGASTAALPHPPTDPNNRDAEGPCDRGTREQGCGSPTPPDRGLTGGRWP